MEYLLFGLAAVMSVLFVLSKRTNNRAGIKCHSAHGMPYKGFSISARNTADEYWWEIEDDGRAIRGHNKYDFSDDMSFDSIEGAQKEIDDIIESNNTNLFVC